MQAILKLKLELITHISSDDSESLGSGGGFGIGVLGNHSAVSSSRSSGDVLQCAHIGRSGGDSCDGSGVSRLIALPYLHLCISIFFPFLPFRAPSRPRSCSVGLALESPIRRWQDWSGHD